MTCKDFITIGDAVGLVLEKLAGQRVDGEKVISLDAERLRRNLNGADHASVPLKATDPAAVKWHSALSAQIVAFR